MRRVILTTAIAASAALGLLTISPMVPAHAAATVVNPGFNASSGTTTPTGWTTSSTNGTTAASYTEATSTGYGGDAYQLTHWSSAAYNVDTYQTLTGLLSTAGLNFVRLAGLLKAGIAGVHAAYPAAEIALHLAGSSSESALASWYSTAKANGVSFDDIGLSYYDYWDGRLDVLQTDLDDLAAEFGKPVFLAETAYPFTLTSNDSSTALSFNISADLDPGYRATPAGQAANFRDVLSVVQAVPNGLGLGAFYWEPTWTVVAGNGWDPINPSSGDGWENQAMWSYSDAALPVIADFAAR